MLSRKVTDQYALTHFEAATDGWWTYTIHGPANERITGRMRGSHQDVAETLNRQIHQANQRIDTNPGWQTWSWSDNAPFKSSPL